MKKLMQTTAFVALMAGPVFAQVSDTTPAQMTDGIHAMLASDFMGQTLYTVETQDARDLRDRAVADGNADSTLRWTSGDVFTANRDAWESVGAIGDVVITQDGNVQGVLIDVGGFLGMFARTVLVDMDELFFVPDQNADSDDLSDYAVIVSLTRADLEALPEWDAERLNTGFTRQGQMMSDTTATADATGFVARTDLSAEALTGASVNGANDDQIGTVEDVIFEADGAMRGLVLDIGGFLGMGAHRVLLPADDLRILWNEQDSVARVEVSMTREQLEQLAEFDG